VLVVEEPNIPVVKVNPFNASVPLYKVAVVVTPIVRLLLKVHVPPTPIKVIPEFIVTPLVLIVWLVVALKVMVPVALHNVPVNNDIEPLTVNVPVLVKVTVPADTVIFKQVNEPVNVTV